MTEDIRGLSLTQPWATLVAIGAKQIETRSWPTSRRGLVAIHATKSVPVGAPTLGLAEPFTSVLKAAGFIAFSQLPRGAIVAVARLANCLPTEHSRGGRADLWAMQISEQERAFGDYSLGRYGWFLEDVRALTDPIPCRGYQGLWPVPADIVAQIRQQLPAGSFR